ncbi:MAG: TOMM precursor leader peptide-binding protein [Candidatus Thorarchaeota archaeon]
MKEIHLQNQLPLRPKIFPYFDIIFMDNQKCQIRAGDDKIFILRGKTITEILPKLFKFLNGDYTINQIANKCKDIASKEEIITILARLNKDGLLEDASIKPPSQLNSKELKYYAPQLLFFSHFKGDKYNYQIKLKESQIAIIGLGLLGSAILLSLAVSGVGHITGIDYTNASIHSSLNPYLTSHFDKLEAKASSSLFDKINPNIKYKRLNKIIQSKEDTLQIVKGKDVVIVAIDKPQPAINKWINESCLDENVPWITSSGLTGIEGIIGPFIIPHETCCYKCYELREKSNMDSYDEYIAFEKYLEEREGLTANYGHLPQFAAIMGSFVALEVLKHLTQFVLPETYGSLFSINFITFQTQFHEVLKLPRCPSCGPAKDVPPKAFWAR